MKKKNLIALVIQARNSSTRLPYKIMKDLCGKKLLERIIERVKKVKKIDKIIIATTKRKEDDIIVALAKKNNVEFFRGSTNNLIDRHYKSVKGRNFKHILRLPADNPLPDAKEYDRLVEYHLKNNNDFSSNICNFMGNGYPDGIGVEIFTFDSLKKIWKKEKRKKFREHLHLNYYDYKKKIINKKNNFKIGTIKCPLNISRPKLIFDINYYKNNLFIRKIYEYFLPKKIYFSTKDVISWYDKIYNKQVVSVLIIFKTITKSLDAYIVIFKKPLVIKINFFS